MRRLRRLIFVAAAACVLVACNLIAGFESEYSVGTSSGNVESGAETGNDGPVDADGSTEGSTDAQPDAERTFCQQANDEPVTLGFCDDFEKVGATSPFEFGTIDVTTDASFSVVARGPRSSALRVVLTNSSGTSVRGWLSKVVGGVPSSYRHLELEFDVRVAAQTLNYAALAILTFESGADREHGVAVEAPLQLGRLSPRSGFVVADDEKWYHCRVTLDREDAGGTFKRSIVITDILSGVQTPVDGPGGTAGLSAPDGGTVELRVGAFNTATNNGSLAVEFDNVIVRRSN